MKQVLVIGSDLTVRHAFESALDNVSCMLLFAADVRQGIQILCDEAVDLVFVDLQVLGADGLQILEWLRTTGNPLPVFVVSPSGESTLRPLQSAARKGFHHERLRTPLGPADIRAATSAVLAF